MNTRCTPAIFLVLSGVLLTSSAAFAQSTAPAQSLPRATPESQGVSSEALRKFIESANAKINSLHSFMLVRHGKVVAEAWWAPETPDKPHVLWSLSKSFTSTAVGLAVAEGKLSIDDRVLQFFPEDAPAEPSENLKNMRVRDLLTMSTGHQDAVIAMTANTSDMQAELNLVWEEVLPAFNEQALPENAAAQKRLQELIAGLKASR